MFFKTQIKWIRREETAATLEVPRLVLFPLAAYILGIVMMLETAPAGASAAVAGANQSVASPGSHIAGDFKEENANLTDRFQALPESSSESIANVLEPSWAISRAIDDTVVMDVTPEIKATSSTVNSGTSRGGSSSGGDVSVTSVDSPELRIPATAPIVHQKYFKGERELFGYSPLFKPNIVTFDLHNRPYMRDKYTIQTLKGGRWIETNWYNATKRLLPNWVHAAHTGPFVDERVVFDKDGCAYTLINDYRYEPPLASHLLFSCDYSTNPTAPTWKAYELAAGGARIEFNDSRNLLQYPPVILVYNKYDKSDKTVLSIIILEKTPQNTLVVNKPVLISESSLLVDAHSGAGNAVVSVGDRVHVVWAGSEAIPGRDGTPQYAATYNRSSKKLSAPVLLGFGGRGKPDCHCAPAITVDSQGYLHVVLGPQTTKLQYIKSLKPNSTTSGWTEAIDVGEPAFPEWSNHYTYVALCCDKKDTLHIVASLWSDYQCLNHGGIQKSILVYLRKRKDKPWDAPKSLVVPFHLSYSIYYHKLNIDRKGRLFVNYMYYADCMTADEIAAYRAKWPDEPIKVVSTVDSRYNCSGLRPHDPCILMSDDSGDTWRLATTKDFVNGVF
jgi:hypothetical protein